jgi:tetratricopeptide (TPR) repeat protein
MAIDLETFLDMPLDRQEARARQAEHTARAWRAASAVNEHLKSADETPAVADTHPRIRSPLLGDIIEHLQAAVKLDPSRADLWYALGDVWSAAGDKHRARHCLRTAWRVCDRAAERQEELPALRRCIAIEAAWIERDDGCWDEGLAWLDSAASHLQADDAEAVLLRGLLLAGRGDLEEAMRLSYGLPEITVPMVGFGKGGLERAPSGRLINWLQAEVWMRRGRPDLAEHVLDDPLSVRNAPLSYRYWQDIGLYAELIGDSRANEYYVKSYMRRPYRTAGAALPLHCEPVIRGQPWRYALFYRRHSGTHAGGSLFAHAASLVMAAQNAEEQRRADVLYQQALDALSVCVRRGVYRDEAAALRGELRFSCGYYNLAEVDLAFARRQFAAKGDIEPTTSYMLGMIALGRERYDEAETLLAEAVAVDSSLSGAWNSLAVVRLQLGHTEEARQALDRAVAADSCNVHVLYNRGLFRCQIGDLSGGLEDLDKAARLEPRNLEVGRLIQLIKVARREGRAFLPIQTTIDRPRPLALDLQIHPGSELAPQTMTDGEPRLQHLMVLFGDRLAESTRHILNDGFTASELARLQADYHAEPSPINRKTWAFGLVWLDQWQEAHRLLVPQWGGDLDADEVLLLLWLDRRLGESARRKELSASLHGNLSMQVAPWRVMRKLRLQFGEHHPDPDVVIGGYLDRSRDLAYAKYVERQMSLYGHDGVPGDHGGDSGSVASPYRFDFGESERTGRDGPHHR